MFVYLLISYIVIPRVQLAAHEIPDIDTKSRPAIFKIFQKFENKFGHSTPLYTPTVPSKIWANDSMIAARLETSRYSNEYFRIRFECMKGRKHHTANVIPPTNATTKMMNGRIVDASHG